MTGAESYDESAEESQYFLIKPDPRCPECAAIMVWRSAHRWIAITNGAEIRLSDNLSVGRHLHVLDLRVAHRRNRVVRERKERERKERFRPVA
jgi:predicted NUDIX family phosphoesterase